MPLKILIAGCSGDERARLEPLVRSLIGPHRATEGTWRVSLVKVGRKLQATVAGPGLRKASFTAGEEDLQASIVEALAGAGPSAQDPSSAPAPHAPDTVSAAPDGAPALAPASAPASTPSAAPAPARVSVQTSQPTASGQLARDRHTCGGCRKPYLVVYETRAGEAQTTVPVACPHCWELNQVSVGEWSAAGQDYRSERA